MAFSLNSRLLMSALLAILLSLVLAHDAAASGGIAGMGLQLQQQIGSLTALIGAASFIVGLVFGASGLMKFKQHSENPQGTPISHAMVRILVAGALISLPSILGTSIGTLFGGATNTTANDGSGLASITRQ